VGGSLITKAVNRFIILSQNWHDLRLGAQKLIWTTPVSQFSIWTTTVFIYLFRSIWVWNYRKAVPCNGFYATDTLLCNLEGVMLLAKLGWFVWTLNHAVVSLQQGSPNCGPRSHFIRPTKSFCQ